MRNVHKLFSKMKPEAQERVKARSDELLKEMVDGLDQLVEPGTAPAEATSSAPVANARRR